MKSHLERKQILIEIFGGIKEYVEMIKAIRKSINKQTALTQFMGKAERSR